MHRKKIVLYLIGAISLVFLAVWISKGAVVFGQSIMDYFLPSAQDTSVPMQEQSVDDSESVVDTPLQENNVYEGDDSRQEAIEKIEAFNEIGQEVYLQPGWLHIVQYKTTFVTEMESFSDGTPIPTEEQIDQWYLLAEGGEVIKSITINDTGDSKTTQIVVYQDKKFTNLTYPNLASSEPEDYYLTSLDLGLEERIKNSPEMNVTIEKIDTDNRINVTTTIYLDEQITYESGITATGYVYVYQFDPTTGVVMFFEDYYLDPDGTPVLRSRLEMISIEKLASPPEDILEYFE